jgi:hypothetical protein
LIVFNDDQDRPHAHPCHHLVRRASRLMLAAQSLRSTQSGPRVIVEWLRIADITAQGVDRGVSGLFHHLRGRRLPVHNNTRKIVAVTPQ